MSENQPEPGDDPAKAFEDLRREISLTRCALEGLTAARERTPDYSVALGQMQKSLEGISAGLTRVQHSPAVRLTPDAMSGELIKASAVARAEDVRLIHEARDSLSRSLGRMDGMIERGQASDASRKQLVRCGIGSALAGILFWSIFPGALARSLPESWHIPEWMAARTMRMEMHEAGAQLTALGQASPVPHTSDVNASR